MNKQEEIKQYIEQIFVEKDDYGTYIIDHAPRNRWSMQVETSELLITQFNHKAVAPAIEKLRSLKDSDQLILQYKEAAHYNPATTRLMEIIFHCSQTTDQKQIVEMLLWKEISLFQNDRSFRTYLLQTLRRIGDDSIVELLKKYAEKIKSIRYPTISFHEVDQLEVVIIINCCLDNRLAKCPKEERSIMEFVFQTKGYRVEI